jgi:hypothetical protein
VGEGENDEVDRNVLATQNEVAMTTTAMASPIV